MASLLERNLSSDETPGAKSHPTQQSPGAGLGNHFPVSEV